MTNTSWPCMKEPTLGKEVPGPLLTFKVVAVTNALRTSSVNLPDTQCCCEDEMRIQPSFSSKTLNIDPK